MKGNVAGTYRTGVLWGHVLGAFRKGVLWHNVGGVWKKLYSLIGATLPGSIAAWDYVLAPADAYADFGIRSDGTWATTGNQSPSSGTWIQGGTGADFEVRFTPSSGTPSAGSSATGTWLSLSSNRLWQCSFTANGGQKACSGTLEIRLAAAPNTVLTSSALSITATVDL